MKKSDRMKILLFDYRELYNSLESYYVELLYQKDVFVFANEGDDFQNHVLYMYFGELWTVLKIEMEVSSEGEIFLVNAKDYNKRKTIKFNQLSIFDDQLNLVNRMENMI